MPVLIITGSEKRDREGNDAIVNACALYDAVIAMKPVSTETLKKQFDKAIAKAPAVDDATRLICVARDLGASVGLSPREMEGVLEAVAGGSAHERANRMGISVNTLEGIVGLALTKWSRLPRAAEVERLQHVVAHIKEEVGRRK